MIRAQILTPALTQLAATLAGQDYRCDDVTGQPVPVGEPVVCEVVCQSLTAVEGNADYFVLWSEDVNEEP
jgi:hypothetical protein